MSTFRGINKGATFRVTLPAIEGDVTAESEAQAETHVRPVFRSRRILLVEDHTDTALMMRALLEDAGYEVVTAADVAQAVEAANGQEFDLLVSDLGLPDGSGLDLLEELRHRNNHIKGIALSGFGREEDIQRSKETGFIEHLTKPVDFDTLLAAVERVV